MTYSSVQQAETSRVWFYGWKPLVYVKKYVHLLMVNLCAEESDYTLQLALMRIRWRERGNSGFS